MKQLKHEYDLFEKFPNGSSLWRGSFPGFPATCLRLQELFQKSKNQFYATSIATGDVVAFNSECDARELLAPLKMARRRKGQAA
jgi:CheY-like chemotaxis protein